MQKRLLEIGRKAMREYLTCKQRREERAIDYIQRLRSDREQAVRYYSPSGLQQLYSNWAEYLEIAIAGLRDKQISLE